MRQYLEKSKPANFAFYFGVTPITIIYGLDSSKNKKKDSRAGLSIHEYYSSNDLSEYIPFEDVTFPPNNNFNKLCRKCSRCAMNFLIRLTT
jgi:hypothetical protein